MINFLLFLEILLIVWEGLSKTPNNNFKIIKNKFCESSIQFSMNLTLGKHFSLKNV
jgi:hypothetical protein